ncbi:MAG: hypothetical protein GC168_06650 [Candidatus Hydrogenedens sp.]|nr:hypothetical protein [Candidatus Hydrogenedens sp.]
MTKKKDISETRSLEASIFNLLSPDFTESAKEELAATFALPPLTDENIALVRRRTLMMICCCIRAQACNVRIAWHGDVFHRAWDCVWQFFEGGFNEGDLEVLKFFVLEAVDDPDAWDMGYLPALLTLLFEDVLPECDYDLRLKSLLEWEALYVKRDNTYLRLRLNDAFCDLIDPEETKVIHGRLAAALGQDDYCVGVLESNLGSAGFMGQHLHKRKTEAAEGGSQ